MTNRKTHTNAIAIETSHNVVTVDLAELAERMRRETAAALEIGLATDMQAWPRRDDPAAETFARQLEATTLEQPDAARSHLEETTVMPVRDAAPAVGVGV